jgi:type 1 glutamine amidotransferase
MQKLKIGLSANKNNCNALSFICCIFIILLTLNNCNNHPATLRGKKILVFTKNGEGYVHNNIPASIDMFFKLSEKEHFKIDTTTNSAIFASTDLQQYDAVVFSNTNSRVFDSQSEKDGLVRFIRSGKGFMGIHIACGTESEWEWYKQMLGGVFDFHPPYQEFPVHVVDNQHPSSSGISSPWIVKDELYIMKEMNPTVRVLMVSDFSSPAFKTSDPMPNTFGKVIPCVWCNTFEGGRQWFTALGHDISCYSDPVYISHILGGLRWIVDR